MSGWRSAAVAAAGLVFCSGSAVAADRAEFHFQDPSISESSGLLATPETVLTVNDSGHEPILYVVDRRSGRTEEAFSFTSEEVVDVEALSWDFEGWVWIGDIGDNGAKRESLTLYRTGVPGPDVRLAAATPYRVRFDDGAHDAEALMFDVEGRVLVATKGVFTGRLYRSKQPLTPDGVSVLHPIGRVPGLVTDGAVSGDGSVLYLRTYGVVAAYSYPALDHLGTFPLPAQDQGEGLALDGDSHLLVSSEGVGQPVYRVAIPESMQASGEPGPDSGTGMPEPLPSEEGSGSGDGSMSGLWIAVAASLVASLTAIRGARRRSRRRR